MSSPKYVPFFIIGNTKFFKNKRWIQVLSREQPKQLMRYKVSNVFLLHYNLTYRGHFVSFTWLSAVLRIVLGPGQALCRY
jgi:hypothetical protein